MEPTSITPPSDTEINWSMAAHLSALAIFVLPALGQIVGPLVIWLFRRNVSPFVAEHATEALNAQISYTIYSIVISVVAVIFFITVILIPLAILLFVALAIFWLVTLILSTMAASKGQNYRYPLSIRLIG